MIRLEILPPAQRAFWDETVGTLPSHWVLYGGTAIVLHLGHRQSLDFDFFSTDLLDRSELRRACAALAAAKTLQEDPNTWTLAVQMHGTPIKLSFFGGIDFGRVSEPLHVPGRCLIASKLDLLGTKLATITQRIEARDYLDVAALLESGLTIHDGVGALLALYGNQASGLQSVKTMAWFKDGNLDAVLPAQTKKALTQAASEYDPAASGPLPKRSDRLD